MNIDPYTRLRYKAIFGLAYAGFGLLAGWRVFFWPAPWNAKLTGLAFAAVLIALGVARVLAFAKARGQRR